MILSAIAFATLAAPSQTLVAAHLMPWFECKPLAKEWGWHWTMGKRDPDKLVNGRPDIAAHYTPEIGPYDSGDPHVLEYQTLLMRFAGIDAVIIDWYGTDDVLDYGIIHRNTQKLIAAAKKAGLKFAICYEDQTLPQIIKAGKTTPEAAKDHARNTLNWVALNWWSDPAYVKIDGRPLLLVFGPQYFKGDEWPDLLQGHQASVYGVSGPHRFPTAGFAWPAPKEGQRHLDAFYQGAKWKPFLGVAYPRFHDFYQEAGLHESYGRILDEDGETFRRTFHQALDQNAPLVQIATWNDWGEGTQIEPSREFGIRDLVATQEIVKAKINPKFSFTKSDLRQPKRLYELRKAGKDGEARAVLESIRKRLQLDRS